MAEKVRRLGEQIGGDLRRVDDAPAGKQKLQRKALTVQKHALRPFRPDPDLPGEASRGQELNPDPARERDEVVCHLGGHAGGDGERHARRHPARRKLHIARGSQDHGGNRVRGAFRRHAAREHRQGGDRSGNRYARAAGSRPEGERARQRGAEEHSGQRPTRSASPESPRPVRRSHLSAGGASAARDVRARARWRSGTPRPPCHRRPGGRRSGSSSRPCGRPRPRRE